MRDLSPPPLVDVALLDRLQVLPGHVERMVPEGALHRSYIALGQMHGLSH